jgi:hypothetical protein
MSGGVPCVHAAHHEVRVPGSMPGEGRHAHAITSTSGVMMSFSCIVWLLAHAVPSTHVTASRVETPRTPHGATAGVTRAAPHRRLALARRKFHAIWGLAARDLARSDTDRRRVDVRWVRPVGARPCHVADLLRVREACTSERARRDQDLSGAPLCLCSESVSLCVNNSRTVSPLCNVSGS